MWISGCTDNVFTVYIKKTRKKQGKSFDLYGLKKRVYGSIPISELWKVLNQTSIIHTGKTGYQNHLKLIKHCDRDTAFP